MSITSLYKGGLVDHPKRGVTELTQLGKSINLNTGRKHMHKLIVEGGKNETTRPTHQRQQHSP